MKVFSNTLVYVLFISITKGEIFTAISHIANLLDNKLEILSLLNNYIRKEELKLTYIKQFVENYDVLTKPSTPTEKQVYLSNPIHSFLLIKKLTSDWEILTRYLSENSGLETFMNLSIEHKSMKTPDSTDLKGAAMSLLRIQEIYELKAKDIADANIPGLETSLTLTANDCFEIGRQAFYSNSYLHMIEWLEEALDRHKRENPPSVETIDILEILAYGYFMAKDYQNALNYTKKILEIMPSHSRSASNKIYYENLIDSLQSEKDNKEKHYVDIMVEDKNDNKLKTETKSEINLPPFYCSNQNLDAETISKKLTETRKNIRSRYTTLCRTNLNNVPKVPSLLECRYVDDHPFLKLQPIKAEEVYLNPLLIMLYDVVTDGEIEYLKKVTEPKLKRALVVSSSTSLGQESSNRTSKHAWLYLTDPVANKISKRIEALTKLTYTTAEALQIANYGIGGHYDPHYDFLATTHENAMKADSEKGNRIATLLIYLTDVEVGGATVFPMLGVGIQPLKGAAVFWFNLFKNGEPDYRTQHAACPVISGSKWVCNQWFHERGQEFTYPCRLNKEI